MGALKVWDGSAWQRVGGLGLGAQSYTPTWTAGSVNPTLGNGTLIGRWRYVDGMVHAIIVLTLGSTSTLGTGSYTFTLPVAMRDYDMTIVTGVTSIPNGQFFGRGTPLTVDEVQLYQAGSNNRFGSPEATTAGWQTNTCLRLGVLYEPPPS